MFNLLVILCIVSLVFFVFWLAYIIFEWGSFIISEQLEKMEKAERKRIHSRR